jgi:hypothetical protein
MLRWQNTLPKAEEAHSRIRIHPADVYESEVLFQAVNLVMNKINNKIGVVDSAFVDEYMATPTPTSEFGNSAFRRHIPHFRFPTRVLGVLTNFMLNFYSHEMMVEVCCINEAKY